MFSAPAQAIDLLARTTVGRRNGRDWRVTCAHTDALEIVAESDEFYRSSEIPLDGDRVPRIISPQHRSLPGPALAGARH